MNNFKKLAIPYALFMLVLTGIPIVLMLLMSCLDIKFFRFEDASFSFAHLASVFDQTYFKALFNSLSLAGIATIGALLIGYPIAYIVSNSKSKYKFIFLLLLIMPMWTNLLLRVETINRLLQVEGFMKNVFGFSLNFQFDLFGHTFSSINNHIAIIVTMTIIYLPFMIFPIYTVLEKTDKNLLEASQDLGANKVATFFKVTLPLSLKGVTSGVTMVFLPSAMGFTIPRIISGDKVQLIGTKIEQYFKGVLGEYNSGSAASLLVIFLVFAALFLMSKIDEDGETLL